MGNSLLDTAYRALIYVTGALIGILLLRVPLRRAFGPQIAYAIWLLVPIAAAGSLIPVKVLAPIAVRVQMPDVRLPWPTLAGVQAPLNNTDWGIVCWIIGALVFALVQWRQQRAFVRRLALMQRTAGGVWMAAVNDVGPVVVGVFPPRVVLPADFHQRYTTREQVLVLAHERAHVVRRDPLANLTAVIVRSLLWFHPLVHLAIRYLRVDQEFACDAAVLEAYSQDRYHYAQAMLKGPIGGSVLPAGCYLDSRAAAFLKRRIVTLQIAPPDRRRRLLGTTVTSALLTAGLGLTLRASALAQIPAARLIGTWLMRQDYIDANLTMRPDSTFTVTVMGQKYMSGRAVRLAGDTAIIEVVDPSTNKLATLPFVLTLSGQKLTVRDRDDNVFVFERTGRNP